jgi:uncharacterized phiE125 gp8 family phage protein
MNDPVVVTKAAKPVISLPEIKQHLAIDQGVTDFDDLLAGFEAAASSHLEKITGRALVQKTFRQTFDGFDCIGLVRTPVTVVTSIGYFDTNGDAAVVEGNVYVTIPGTPVTRVVLVSGASWPVYTERWDAVTVEYEAGTSPYDVPKELRAAIALHVGFLFANRESHAEKPAQPTGAYDALIFPYRHIYV